jgi:peptidoglycan/xylan/chitin deacetylase (PgdA/CDA1 family)
MDEGRWRMVLKGQRGRDGRYRDGRGRAAWIVVLGCLLLGCLTMLALRSPSPRAGSDTRGRHTQYGARAPRSSASTHPHLDTVVSLTFDDGRQDQYTARALLAAHGMHGTFYVNSGLVAAKPGRWHMTWSQLQDLAADGNEIGGHSLTHAHLTQLSSADLQGEICNDRTNLLRHGFSPVTSFAYPFGEFDATVRAVVQRCGYTSARRVSGLRASDCRLCPFAATIPPRRPWAIRAARDIRTETTLETMKGYVTQAENHGGGWVMLVFHAVCDACDPYSVTETQLTAFLDWLQPRASSGTVVKTHGEVIGDGGLS